MSDLGPIDPEAALSKLTELIGEVEDPDLRKELQEVRAKSPKGKEPSRPSFEKKAEEIVLSPPESVPESSRRIDEPDIAEVEQILLSEGSLTSQEVRTVLLGLYRNMEMHHQYVDEGFRNLTAAIESLNRKAEFLSVLPSKQIEPIRADKPAVFSVPKEEIGRYLSNAPPTGRAVRTRLIEIIKNVPGEWKSEKEVSNLSTDVCKRLVSNWSEVQVRKILEA